MVQAGKQTPLMALLMATGRWAQELLYLSLRMPRSVQYQNLSWEVCAKRYGFSDTVNVMRVYILIILPAVYNTDM